MAGVDAVVFDMDGTLFDSSEVVPDAYVATVAELAGRTLTRQQVIAAYPVGPPAVLLAHLTGRPADVADASGVARYHAALRLGASALRPYPGVEEALSDLSAVAGLAVFTGADRIGALMLLEATGLADRFAAVVGSDEIERPKPDPEGIVEACRRLGAKPDRAAYVGDSARDLEAAKRSGALAVAAAWGHEFDPDVPADAVADAPADLVRLLA
jgi:HAD superfamily hydrolase (TIGR01509 family)